MAAHADLTSVHLFAYVQDADPGAVGAGKGWVDTTGATNVLKIRNAADSGWETVSAAAADLAAHLADAADAHDAAAISFAPAGTIAATTVQAAIEEVASEAGGGGGATELDDLTDVDTATTPPSDGDVLTYDNGSSLWVPAAPSGGGGGTVHTDAHASPPASPANGDVWVPSDSAILYHRSGGAWVGRAVGGPLTAPVDGDFSWVNQGIATVSTTKGGIYLHSALEAGVNMHLRVKAHTAPRKYTVGFYPGTIFADFSTCGLAWRQSSDGKLVAYKIMNSALYITHASGPTVEVANFSQISLPSGLGGMFWLQIEDDNTNLIFRYSVDGVNFHADNQNSRSAYLTAPDQVGFFVTSRGSNRPASMWVLSWKEE